MFVEEIKSKHKSKNYRTVLIRETYRECGVVKHRTLANISKLPEKQILTIKQALKNTGKEIVDKLTNVKQTKITSSREYGASFVILSLIKRLKLDQMIYSKKVKWRENVLAMICGRLVYPGSKLSLVNQYADTALWELCGHSPCVRPDVDKHCYHPLDKLLKRQEQIQENLAKRHLKEGCMVLYDLSSSYVTGDYNDSELIQFGYSRDRKRGFEQVNFGLLTTDDGCPVAVETFPGNTSDQITVRNQIDRVVKRFKIKTLVFVGDRGMLTSKRIREVNQQGFRTITALTHSQMRKLIADKVISKEDFKTDDNPMIKNPNDATISYVLCFNPYRKKSDSEVRQNLICRTQKELKALQHRKTRKSTKEICSAAGKVWKRYKTEKYFYWNVDESGALTFQLKTHVIDSEAMLDGCYVIRSDVDEKQMSGKEVLETYRKLLLIENAFRNLKTTCLELRPLYHHLDDRIRAHVFLCMLAYYVQWHMLRLLDPLFQSNCKGKHRQWTFERVIGRLASVRIQTCLFKNDLAVPIKSTPDGEQKKLLQLLRVNM